MKVLMIKMILTVWVFAIVLVGYVNTQRRGDSDPTPNNKTGKRDSEYQFRLGERLRASFLENCSLLFGVVGNIEEKRFEFAVQERLSGDSETRIEKLRLSLPSDNSRNSLNSPWEKASAEPGLQLIVGVCGENSDRFRTVISNEEYFSSVRNVIAFENQMSQSTSTILDIPKILATQHNPIFAGYAISVLSGSSKNKNDVALVLSQILEDRSVLPVGLALTRIKLRQLLIRDGDQGLSANTRHVVFERMIRAANQIGASNQVFILMSELADKSKLDIQKFVNSRNRYQLQTNYEAFLKSNSQFKPQPSIQQQISGN